MIKKWIFIVLVALIFAIETFPVHATDAKIVYSPYYYSFNIDGTLYESERDQLSSSPYWYLNSGAKLIISNGTGKTIQGELPSNDKWRLIYLNSNKLDTDNGYHPQNIFRLFTRSKWDNFFETAYFKIMRDQLSISPNRDAHNGLLLIIRSLDNNNLYYAGIRVDGNAIIKKKLNGAYYTLASKKIFQGTYNRQSNPNLIPKRTWIGLRSMINNSDGKVNIKLYIDQNKTGNWTLILNVYDTNSPIVNGGYAGLRTDFMDVQFDDFSIINS